MPSPIKTLGENAPGEYNLPEIMYQFVAHCPDELMEKERTADPYPKFGKVFTPDVKADAYLQKLRMHTEAKVRTGNIVNSYQLVEFILGTLDPFECFGFIKLYRDKLFADGQNPYILFLLFFHTEYMAEATETERYDTFTQLLRGPPLEDNAKVVKQFLFDVRQAKMALPGGYVAAKGCVVDFRRRLPATLRRRVLSALKDSKHAGWDEWMTAAQQVVNDLLADESVSHDPAPVPASAARTHAQPDFNVATPAQPEGMDIGAVLSALVGAVQGLQKGAGEVKKKQQKKKPFRGKGKGAGKEIGRAHV